jgi:hypothetical protein
MASAYRAGQSAGQNYVDIHRETVKYANKPNEINKVAYKAQVAEKKIATEIDARAKKNEIKAQSITDRGSVKAGIYDKQKSADKSKRKAGIVAGIGMIASDIITENKMGKAPRRERDDFTSIDSYMESIKSKFEADRVKELATPLDTSTNANVSTNISELNSSATPSTLTGKRKIFADAIAGPESGPWGYDAFNQGGAKGGTKVLGKRGSHKETYGRALTDMTLGEIFHKQNTKQRGLSFDEHLSSGGLHAVGRYQFIGGTLQDEVRRMGLSTDTKFTPEVQDNIFFSHAKRVGNISPWIGPSVEYNPAKRAELNNMIPGL